MIQTSKISEDVLIVFDVDEMKEYSISSHNYSNYTSNECNESLYFADTDLEITHQRSLIEVC